MVAEENEAKSQGKPCPVHDGIQATHNSYNSTANWLLQKIRDNSNQGRQIRFVLASHNQDSIKQAVERYFQFYLVTGYIVETGQMFYY